jgi:hypothetical protein
MEWTQFATFLIANMVFTLTLWLWNRSESRQDNRRALDLIEAIQKEMKDFHIKLALQDQEFKMRLCNIEEKNKK